jgi:hypothetical protein
LTVTVEGTPSVPEMEPVTFTDRIELQQGGQELWAFVLVMDGEAMPHPVGPLRYVRTSDVPF